MQMQHCQLQAQTRHQHHTNNSLTLNPLRENHGASTAHQATLLGNEPLVPLQQKCKYPNEKLKTATTTTKTTTHTHTHTHTHAHTHTRTHTDTHTHRKKAPATTTLTEHSALKLHLPNATTKAKHAHAQLLVCCNMCRNCVPHVSGSVRGARVVNRLGLMFGF